MGLNSTVVLTVVLLTMMFGAGFTSAVWGYGLGRSALKEITQPDVRPNNLAKNKNGTRHEGVILLQEKDILATVKKRMEGKDTEVASASGKNAKKPTAAQAQKPKTENAASTSANNKSVFPIVSRDGGVSLEVTEATRQGNSLVLNVNLKNESQQSVRFLYSFLNVTDDKGRALSASVEELPGQLAPNSKVYSGTVTIPTALVENSKELTMSLTDYPDQKMQLQMSGIPVAQ
ncbi:hypothetical protein [Planktothrix mougeotii]|uniref:DUF4352 domain-containing protein n=1 Tax=Planktothrix mougeotii LEGE 06226 TaxID=1828728 RepID=A0ABR9UHD6_9CYAN|nr:hypothetical protein [Planktothrix mougeotii]MBE9145878.1 hypothetical protein [Planktothrix mougeotii LEGE 06226]